MKRIGSAVYLISFMLMVMIPCLGFATGAVVLILHNHPYMSIPFIFLSLLTIPKIDLSNLLKDGNEPEKVEK